MSLIILVGPRQFRGFHFFLNCIRVNENKLCCSALIHTINYMRTESYNGAKTLDRLSSAFPPQNLCARFKSKKRNQSSDPSEEELSDDEEQDWILDIHDYEAQEIKVKSLRIDKILKAILHLNNRSIEEAILTSRVKINGRPISKKSVDITVGDEVEVGKENSMSSKKFTLMNYKILNDWFIIHIKLDST